VTNHDNIISMKYRIVTVLLICSIPFSFSFGTPVNPPDSGDLHKAIFRALTRLLEAEHYSSPTFNDKLSATIWKTYLNDLDPDKKIFLNRDIIHLSKYETTLDDEMRANSVEFFDTVMTLYKQRVTEAIRIYHSMLDKPITLHSKRMFLVNRAKTDYPADEAQRRSLWEDYIRLNMLKRATEPGDSLVVSAPAQQRELWNQRSREKIRKWLDNLYVPSVSSRGEEEKFSQYMTRITLCMDPHTQYFAPADARTMSEQMSHRFYGLGMELGTMDGDVVIKQLLPGGNAFKSGLLKVNDRILAVSDDKDQMVELTGLPVTEAAKLIRGEKGTFVRLQVAAPGSGSRVIRVERGEIVQEEAGAKGAVIQQGARKIGYIYLPMFYLDAERPDGAHCSVDVEKIVRQLKEQGVDAIIMDLRNNPGGSLTEVVQMAGLFINPGPVVQIKSKEKTEVMSKLDGEALYKGPLAVLVNEFSASASEIFAAAMQDYKRAVIIGSTTYGKGTAQAEMPMGRMGDRSKGTPNINYGSVRMTIDKFYRISGGATQLKGVIPDLELPDGKEYLPYQEKDNAAALPYDEIPSAEYQPIQSNGYTSVIASDRIRISQDSTLNFIRRNTDWLKQHQNSPFSLDLAQYQVQVAAINAHNAQITKAQMLDENHALDIRGMHTVSDNGDNLPMIDNAERNRQWMKGLSKDIYIYQTMGVLKELIEFPDKANKDSNSNH
jgi:carboxyl-terminal processing protease